jgi:hypothetical protein
MSDTKQQQQRLRLRELMLKQMKAAPATASSTSSGLSAAFTGNQQATTVLDAIDASQPQAKPKDKPDKADKKAKKDKVDKTAKSDLAPESDLPKPIKAAKPDKPPIVDEAKPKRPKTADVSTAPVELTIQPKARKPVSTTPTTAPGPVEADEKPKKATKEHKKKSRQARFNAKKKLRKQQEGRIGAPPPGFNVLLKQSLEYLQLWKEKRNEWTFRWRRQVFLLKYLFQSDVISEEVFPTLVAYIKTQVNGDSRTELIQKAKAVLAGAEPTQKTSKASAPASQPLEGVMDDLIKQAERQLREIKQKKAEAVAQGHIVEDSSSSSSDDDSSSDEEEALSEPDAPVNEGVKATQVARERASAVLRALGESV